MAVCAHYRIPHSQFLGWDPDDRNKAIAWHLRQAETCQGCGTRPEEWDPTQGGHLHAYRAEIRKCPGCAVTAQAAQTLHERQEQGELGLHLALTPTPSAERR